MTWSIPVFAAFYLIAPFTLKRIKGVWSALVLWIGMFGITAVIRRFYDCDLTAKLHYLFLGVLVFFCIQKKMVPFAVAAFSVVVIGATIVGAKAIVYTFAFAGVGSLIFLRRPQMALLADGKLVLIALGLAVVCTVLPYLFYTAGLARMDSGKAAILASVEPVVAALVGIVVFHEPLSPATGLGVVSILAAVLLLR